MRGALLATAATFLGCALFFTLPDFVAAQMNKAMPYWFYESEVGHSSLHLLASKPCMRHRDWILRRSAQWKYAVMCKGMINWRAYGTDDASGSGHGIGKLDHDILLPLTCLQAERDIRCYWSAASCVCLLDPWQFNCHQIVMRTESHHMLSISAGEGQWISQCIRMTALIY